ncbi:MAG: DUF3558 family protein [Pseudonocardiaceae bacterium]
MRHSGWVPLLAVVGLLVGGCGSSPQSGTPSGVGDASGVDMCTILTNAELSGLGIDPGSREQVDELGVVGCQWVGQPIRLSLERDEDPVAEYVARRDDPAFKSFRENTVNGRAAAQLSVRRGGEQCVQLIDGGPVSLAVAVGQAFSRGPVEVDPCAEALRIAEMIEPRLPKAGT